MMTWTKGILLFLLLSSSINLLKSQCSPAGSDNCEDAPVFCSLDELNGYSCKNIDYVNTAGCSPLCPSGGIANNISWWAFVCDGGMVCLTITTTNCSINGSGIEAGVWADCECKESKTCNVNCTGPGTKVICGVYNMCQTYYLYIDGCNGDICNFIINTSGGSKITLPKNISFDGLSQVCTGSCNINYVVKPNFGSCNLNYLWTLDGVSLDVNNKQVLLDFPTEGNFTLCLSTYIGNSYSGTTCDIVGPICKNIMVRNPIDRIGIPRYVCDELIPYSWQTQQITTSGIYKAHLQENNCCTFDSVIQVNILPKPNDGNYTVILLDGETYKDPNTKTTFNTCQNDFPIIITKSTQKYKCDSTYLLNISIIKADGTITDYCDSSSYYLQAKPSYQLCNQASQAINNAKYNWYRKCDTSKSSLGNSFILPLLFRDNYCVDISYNVQLNNTSRSIQYTVCETNVEDLPEFTQVCNDEPYIQGRVFYDQNQDGIFNNNEQLAIGSIIETNPISNYSIHQNNNYTLRLNKNLQTEIQANNLNPLLYQITPTSYIIPTTNTTGLQPGSFDFALSKKVNKTDLELSLATTQIIPNIQINAFVTITNLCLEQSNSYNIEIELPQGIILLNSFPLAPLQNGNKLNWNNVKALSAQGKFTIQLLLSTDNSLQVGTDIQIQSKIDHAGDINLYNNQFIWKDKIKSSADPLNLLVDTVSITRNSTQFNNLTYTVRIQNQYSINMSYIKIKDIVSPLLDFKSFKVLNSSHPYTIGLSKSRVAYCIFDKAKLQPASIDWLNSQLIFQFAIRPGENLPNLTVIDNTISFTSDCLPELKSNQVESKYIITKVGQLDNNEIEIIPNPFDNYIEVNYHLTTINSDLKICNYLGQEILQFKKLNTNRIRVNTSDWATGIYFFSFYHNGKLKVVRRVVKR